MERSMVNTIVCILIISVFYFGNIESILVQHYDCWKPRDSKPCTIHSVAIDPCPSSKKERTLGTPCELVRGNVSATIKFEYTPEFNSTNPLAQAHKSTLLQDLPLIGMDTNACMFTKCPVVQGVQNTYTFPMEIKTEYPEGAYTVKWKLWNANEPIKEVCCLKFKITLI